MLQRATITRLLSIDLARSPLNKEVVFYKLSTRRRNLSTASDECAPLGYRAQQIFSDFLCENLLVNRRRYVFFQSQMIKFQNNLNDKQNVTPLGIKGFNAVIKRPQGNPPRKLSTQTGGCL